MQTLEAALEVPVAAADLLTNQGIVGWLRTQLSTFAYSATATHTVTADSVRLALGLARLASATLGAWAQQREAQQQWPLGGFSPLAEALVAAVGTFYWRSAYTA